MDALEQILERLLAVLKLVGLRGSLRRAMRRCLSGGPLADGVLVRGVERRLSLIHRRVHLLCGRRLRVATSVGRLERSRLVKVQVQVDLVGALVDAFVTNQPNQRRSLAAKGCRIFLAVLLHRLCRRVCLGIVHLQRHRESRALLLAHFRLWQHGVMRRAGLCELSHGELRLE